MSIAFNIIIIEYLGGFPSNGAHEMFNLTAKWLVSKKYGTSVWDTFNSAINIYFTMKRWVIIFSV